MPLNSPLAADPSAPAARSAPLKKIVYFIASHVCPDQVVRLVKACRSGDGSSRVLIHHDYKVSHLDPAAVESLENVDLLREHAPVEWGGFTQCVMIARSMQWLLDHRDFDWVVYLSGQDYPIKPPRRIEQELSDTPCDGFLDAVPVEDRSWLIGHQRYSYQYYEWPKVKGLSHVRNMIRRRTESAVARNKLPRLVAPQASAKTGAHKVGYRPFFSPFRGGMKCYAGSSWWTLNRRSIEYILKVHRDRPDLVRYYRRVLFAPNESYFLTILGNAPDLNLRMNDNRRLVSWSHPHTGHPDVLRADDFDRIIASGCDFGRKIDSRVDARLLDLLDDYIRVPHFAPSTSPA